MYIDIAQSFMQSIPAQTKLVMTVSGAVSAQSSLSVVVSVCVRDTVIYMRHCR